VLYFRVDDFPGTKPEEFYRHNLENFREFHRVMSERDLPYVLGVIPRHATQEQLAWLWEQDGIEVALHGVDHDERFLDEFREHQTAEDIVQALSSGLRSLAVSPGMRESRSFFVRAYIPPHNVLNPRTIQALPLAGLTRVMTGPGTTYEMLRLALSTSGLTVHHSTEPLTYGRSDELLQRGSVQHVKYMASGLGGGVADCWLTLHWTWEQNIGLDNLRRYLDELLRAVPPEHISRKFYGQVL
jgi:hypothetical protein